MKNFRLTVLAALLAFSASQVAFAQAPAAPAGGTTTSTTTTTADDGTVSNANALSSTTTTTTTNTGGIAADAPVAVVPDTEIVTTEATLTNTGGEPVLMTLAGLAIVMSALAFRRKVQA